ncbi:MAG: tripartite tricarboxylate transporter TctB family protein [Geminicoccaceae bacterium]|nr:tripartite tricarboxylate transporter TctB family protein [Geminicoccaceae bacterium]MCB9942235.1 tripartite tricarboxylate transporter TctB family protein [Geminicoccaceae bacterium]
MSDRILGGLLILLAVAFVVAATRIESAMIFDSLGPKAFPILIGVLLGLAGLYPLLRPDPEPDWPAWPRFFEVVLGLAILIGYAQLLQPLGFLIATAIAASLLSWRLGGSLLAAPVIGIGLSAGIYTVFHLILGLSLARGPFGF